MTTRELEVYKLGEKGFGCFITKVFVFDTNFIAEDADTITLLEGYLDDCGGTYDKKVVYYKNAEAFIRNENVRYIRYISDLKSKHETTIQMAKTIQRNQLTYINNQIPF